MEKRKETEKNLCRKQQHSAESFSLSRWNLVSDSLNSRWWYHHESLASLNMEWDNIHPLGCIIFHFLFFRWRREEISLHFFFFSSVSRWSEIVIAFLFCRCARSLGSWRRHRTHNTRQHRVELSTMPHDGSKAKEELSSCLVFALMIGFCVGMIHFLHVYSSVDKLQDRQQRAVS